MEFVVLDQGMIGFLWEEQGRPRKRIDGVVERDIRGGKRRADEFYIMLKNIVPANKIRPPEKQGESLKRSLMKLPAIVPTAANVMDFFAMAVGFGIEKGDGGHTSVQGHEHVAAFSQPYRAAIFIYSYEYQGFS